MECAHLTWSGPAQVGIPAKPVPKDDKTDLIHDVQVDHLDISNSKPCCERMWYSISYSTEASCKTLYVGCVYEHGRGPVSI